MIITHNYISEMPAGLPQADVKLINDALKTNRFENICPEAATCEQARQILEEIERRTYYYQKCREEAREERAMEREMERDDYDY